MGRVDWWSLSDAQLLRQCQVDRYRASGPGGQKRNKTDSAVRLRHQPTGLIITASESRSQHENRQRALRRLRRALAFEHRQPFPDEIPELLARARGAHLRVPSGDERFLPTAAAVLDLLDACEAAVSLAAKRIDLSTARLVAFLRTTSDLWQAAQKIRSAYHRPPLR